jgi:hypothetical protein
MVVGKNEVCVLWIKKEGHFFKVSELPNDGVKNIILSEAMLKKNECYKEFHSCLVYSIVFGDEMSVLFSIEMTTMACLIGIERKNQKNTQTLAHLVFINSRYNFYFTSAQCQHHFRC